MVGVVLRLALLILAVAMAACSTYGGNEYEGGAANPGWTSGPSSADPHANY